MHTQAVLGEGAARTTKGSHAANHACDEAHAGRPDDNAPPTGNARAAHTHPTWRAELALEFERRGPRTVLARRRHDGPLVVQKPFYPEGDGVCHAIVVHPPAGIAGGDELRLDVDVGTGAHALLTTPGAGKWYRSAGRGASQGIQLTVRSRAALEWLPQETIVYDGASAALQTNVSLAAEASYLGWEIVCLGRTGSGERFTRGVLSLATEVRRGDRLVWIERARIEGGGRLLDAPVGMRGAPVFGTLVAVGGIISRQTLDQLRAEAPLVGEGATTHLPELLVARYLGPSTEAARDYFARLWSILRPALAGREAVRPRIWGT